ncbi:hypothetical protein L3Q82_003793 [Scortum barcoo]|uniref:Uncharacterized protein n=1 Tax=Scortum barcoo TaxID=214431 RepID=A0ACB8X6Y8_9TELE|nr:hypothetical protein L3Q82_003793 [Scortum barcoo]
MSSRWTTGLEPAMPMLTPCPRRPCAPDGCRYCEKREAREKELCVGEGRGPTHDRDGPPCREAQVIVSPEWRTQQEQDADLKPVLRWVESGQKPQWNEVAGCSPATKGLFEKFWGSPGEGRSAPEGLERGQLQGRRGRGPQGTERDSVKSLSWNCWGRTLWSLKNSLSTPARILLGSGQLRRDVEDFCRRCDLCTCAQHKGPPDQSRAQLQQLPVGAPMERVAVDIMGPFPRTDKGNRYVLAAMDYFTKWPEAYAIPDQEAETVANALVEGMFTRFGTRGHSQGQQKSFTVTRGETLSQVCSLLLCVIVWACKRPPLDYTLTPSNPQSDGLVERFNSNFTQNSGKATHHPHYRTSA